MAQVTYGKLHRDALVESSVMASIDPPDPTHRPSLPDSLLYGERGKVTFSQVGRQPAACSLLLACCCLAAACSLLLAHCCLLAWLPPS